MLKRILLFLIVIQSGAVMADQIYLLGSFTVRGSPVTKAVLLQDRNVPTLDQCKDFIRHHIRGSERGRNYFRHYIRKQKGKGVNIQPRYTCLQTDIQISLWDDNGFYKNTYLVDLRSEPGFTLFSDTNSCWAAIRKQPEKHSSKLFCAKMSQTVQ